MNKEEKDDLLKNNNAFCILPWIHMHVWPNGNAMPCCIADSDAPFGNVNDDSIEDVWNSEKYKELRLAMLNGERKDVCRRCHQLEDTTYSWTLRQNHNEWFGDKHIDLVDKTNEDGSIDEFRMAYFDIRFSNICNMKCRSCGPELSSLHAKEHKEVYGERELIKMLKNDGNIVVNIAENPEFWESLQKYLPDVEEVYWAGGEALITKEHYDLLDEWLRLGKTDVRLRYTTNFSNFKFKKKSVIDYWKQFDDVQVSASLDCSGPRAEYSRYGTNWKTIEQNRIEMMEAVPDVHFELTPTISLYNVWQWPDFHMDWVERGLVDIRHCRMNYLTHPTFMSVNNAPDEVRAELKRKYMAYRKWAIEYTKDMSEKDQHHVIQKIESVVYFLKSGEENISELKKFIENNNRLDKIRDEDFWTVFPELGWLRDYE